MKQIHILIMALLAASLTACMDGDWDDPQTTALDQGNKALEETNVVSIAKLKASYAGIISSGDVQKIGQLTQIKGTVTGNDIEGNLYNEIAIDDGTGAILVCVAQGGLCGQFPVGTQVLVELKDLYIGSYGQQPEIGTPYTNKNGRTYVSRMARALWADHYNVLSLGNTVSPTEFDKTKVGDAAYIAENCGKLMTIRGVQFQAASSSNNAYAPEGLKDAANCVNRNLTGISSNQLVVRTSTYADFAAKPLPTGTVDITGIFTRYNNTWQILIRQESDVQPATQAK